MSGTFSSASNAPLVQVPSILFCLLSPAAVGVRFWSRMRMTNNIGVDDWTILGSCLCSMAVSILLLASCSYGFGKHITSLTPENKRMALKLFYVAQAFYKVNINMTKASILLLYLRIFIEKPFRIICWIMLSIIVAYGIASTAASIFQCTPIPRAWNKAIEGHCIDITKNWFANAGFSIATDCIILCLPMPSLYSLRLPRNRKLALMLVFALGSFVVVTSTLRMTTLNLSSKSPDTTYQITSSLWTVIEENIGIICACLPMFRPPLSLLFPRLFPNRDGSSYGASGKLSNASSSRSEWAPPTPMNRRNDVRLTVVSGGSSRGREGNGEAGVRRETQFDVSYGGGSGDGNGFGSPRSEASDLECACGGKGSGVVEGV